ncbi:MAG: hypothetical protein JSV65_12845 [Armatimonadota bacterium]|nr:MAG: hypothetical protein JSV65_12845 [Armatimonadota bacterium]
MNEHALDFARRIERLERQNRRLKLGMLGLAAVFGAVLFVGAVTPQEIVEAEKFVLRDAEGRQRAVLQVPEWGPCLSLYDAAGTTQVALYINGSRPGVRLSDTNGKERAILEVDEGPLFALFDERGQQRAGIGVQETGDKTWPEGAAFFLFDADGRPRVTLDAFPRGPELVLHDATGKPIYRAPKATEGARQ